MKRMKGDRTMSMYKKVSTDMNFVDREKATEAFWKENRSRTPIDKSTITLYSNYRNLVN